MGSLRRLMAAGVVSYPRRESNISLASERIVIVVGLGMRLG